jgi:hypothetical protein
MNHAKKVQSTSEGFPIVNGAIPKPVMSYPLRKLRKGTKMPEAASDYRPSTQAAKDFEEKILNDEKPRPTIKSDILEEVVPVFLRAGMGIRAHGDAIKNVALRTMSFAALSARAIVTSFKVVARRAVSRI